MVEKSEFFRLIDEMRDFGQELCDLRKALASIASIASMVDAVQLDLAEHAAKRISPR
jgi:hypothetical protein